MGKGLGNQFVIVLAMLISLLLGYAFGAARKEGSVSIKLFSTEVRVTIVNRRKDDAMAKDKR